MKRVLVLTETDPLDTPETIAWSEFDAVVLAFWAGPEFVDALRGRGARDCLRLNEIVTDYPALVARAFACAHTVAEQMPLYREVNPWRAWENVIATTLLAPQVAVLLHKRLAAQAQAAEICFLRSGDMQRAFEIVNAHAESCFTVQILQVGEQAAGHTRGRLGTWWALVGEARQDRDFRNLLDAPVEALDANYAWRARIKLPADVSRGGTLCYSSYVNYSRVLARHAGGFHLPAQWVVNSHSAHRGLPEGTRPWDLWQFGKIRFDLHAAALAQQSAALRTCPETAEGLPLHALLASNSIVRETAERVMPRLLSEVDLMTGLLEQASPQAVWVANQWGGEGCLVQAAQARGIPVTQVQHGVLEPYFGCAPLYTDRFLVWSEFWRRALPERVRERVEVDATGLENKSVVRKSDAGHKRITFFTAPPDITPFWNPSVAAWEIMTLLARLLQDGYTVALRAHPMDRIGRYQALAESAAPIEWDKGTPLADRMARTDGAVMMFSTTVLECVANGIPVTGLGWYDFMWKCAVEAAGYIRYEDSLDAVEARVQAQV